LKEKTKATPRDLRHLIEFQEYRCALSGVPLTPEVARLDHIKPVADGGNDLLENLQWVHEDVNRMKGSLSQDQFIKWCSMIASWTR
jgi:5-methylcytosine-specific restriction endonuclease McrA